CMQGLGFQWTF
nr:immunoglobulin light chain junction region [Macaca mulatta]MOV61167.1 immunoglobulin light chain junction region [Macaca mulatta]MOV61311.1 immunoglobulin light chain junction region [Macaca mulatta]MOV61412.1 immunoglobulin light chain junction region [Macaca mulatta]MOV61558.1 immunoglobulin light chain junction region [Macaca mulatta]